ncbi:MAG TPA: hypothetical protein VGC80_14535 [Acetobacteraceae bacterium]
MDRGERCGAHWAESWRIDDFIRQFSDTLKPNISALFASRAGLADGGALI